jgi:hypothetical protein
MNESQTLTVIKSTANSVVARNDVVGLVPVGAGLKSAGAGNGLAPARSVFILLSHAGTDIDRPARCHDKPISKAFHCWRDKPGGRCGTIPRSRATVDGRR